MSGEIFLSASIPVKGRGDYYLTADPILIQSAVRAFAEIVLGRRRIVWGGHPTITPMLMEACSHLGVSYGDYVTLYQSEFFDQEYPEENAHFQNVVFTPKLAGDRDGSLALMRNQMLERPDLEAAVFIGGMAGVIDEADLFAKMHPGGQRLFIGSTGGAALECARMSGISPDEEVSIDYFGIFYSGLDILPDEPRAMAGTKKSFSP
jgi:hypothetical protein